MDMNMVTNKKMTFEEVLASEYKSLVEQIEHGSSDPKVLADLKKKLKEKTGYSWVD